MAHQSRSRPSATIPYTPRIMRASHTALTPPDSIFWKACAVRSCSSSARRGPEGRPAHLHDDRHDNAASRRRGDRDEAVAARQDAASLEAALVAIDPRNGHVLAMVGGRDFHTSSFNRAMQAKRQPGSAFKPLLFAAAIEQGYTPSSLLTGMDTPIHTAQGEWLPSGEHEAASYTLRQALTVSSNRAAARVMQLVGITTTQTYARRLGISSPLPAVPSLALGTGEVTLLDLTSAYGAFANGGIIAPHTLITRIEDRNGNHLAELARSPSLSGHSSGNGVFDVEHDGRRDEPRHGVARAHGRLQLPAAGKTGTTDDYADAWFVGYTPNLVAGVWFGYDEKKKIMNRGFAGTVAVPAWARFMKKATEGSSPDWFDMPADVERIAVCRRAGCAQPVNAGIVSEDGRSNVYEDYYLMGPDRMRPAWFARPSHGLRWGRCYPGAPAYDGSFCRVLTMAPITPRPSAAIAMTAIHVEPSPIRLAPYANAPTTRMTPIM